MILGIVGLVGLNTFAQEAQAWGWLRDKCCCSKFTTTLCIKPYNAFSPVAYGTIVGDGCMPVNVFGGYAGQQPSSFAPGCCSSGCCGGGCLPAPGGVMSGPIQMLPGQPMPSMQFAPPAPGPIQQSSQMFMVPAAGYGYSGIQPVGYQPAVNPYINMGYYGQQPGQVPSYWYGR
jgi:hypothetical protein